MQSYFDFSREVEQALIIYLFAYYYTRMRRRNKSKNPVRIKNYNYHRILRALWNTSKILLV